MKFKRAFPVLKDYRFLNNHGLEKESDEIRNSTDRYKTRSTRLRRAKILSLVTEKNLLSEFCNSVWPSGLTEKGKGGILFFENLLNSFQKDPEGVGDTDDPDDEDLAADNTFAYENDLRNYLLKNLIVIEKG